MVAPQAPPSVFAQGGGLASSSENAVLRSSNVSINNRLAIVRKAEEEYRRQETNAISQINEGLTTLAGIGGGALCLLTSPLDAKVVYYIACTAPAPI